MIGCQNTRHSPACSWLSRQMAHWSRGGRGHALRVCEEASREVETDLLVKCSGDCLTRALVQWTVLWLCVDFVHVDAELPCQGCHRIAVDAGNHCSPKVSCSLVSIRLSSTRRVVKRQLASKDARVLTTAGDAETPWEPEHGTRHIALGVWSVPPCELYGHGPQDGLWLPGLQRCNRTS